MSSLRDAVKDYLALRRSLGYQLYGHELLLHDFADFAQRNSVDTVTIELAVRWARLPKDAKPIWWATRLGVIRGFARYLATIDPRTEVPPRDLMPARAQRLAPYIYSPFEIQALMEAAATLQPPLRGATHRTLIGLLAATGLRLGRRSAWTATTSISTMACCGCVARTTSGARCRCMRPQPARSPTMPACATGSGLRREVRRSSSARPASGSEGG